MDPYDRFCGAGSHVHSISNVGEYAIFPHNFEVKDDQIKKKKKPKYPKGLKVVKDKSVKEMRLFIERNDPVSECQKFVNVCFQCAICCNFSAVTAATYLFCPVLQLEGSLGRSSVQKFLKYVTSVGFLLRTARCSCFHTFQ